MKAVFLDRDGVLNELVYHQEQGIIDSPFTVSQFRMIHGVPDAINRLHKMRYKVIVISNQPGIAKGHMSQEVFDQIRLRMKNELAKNGASIDAEYYCFHHPDALVCELKCDCECRKPKPGLLFKAAKEWGIDLASSWMIGDGLTDIKAGKSAGCRTILLGKKKCELCRQMDEENAKPDEIRPNLLQAIEIVLNERADNG